MSILINWLESMHEEINVSSKCSRERNRKSTCHYCIDKCEPNAMKLMGDLLSIDSNKCTMCGECVIECPLSAIRGIANNRLFDKGSLVYDGSFTPSVKELLIYKKKGMTSVQIAQEPLNQAWETVLGVTNAQLNLLDESPIVIEEKAMDAMLSRRAFFGSFQQEGRKLAKSMAPVSWRMEQDDWKLTKYYPDYQFFSVYIKKDQCTLCQACFSLCPENVFLLKEGELQIHNEKCVNCTSCTDVCPENAIEIIPDMQRKRECAEHIQLKTCKDCGQSFYTYYSETEKCHVCTNRNPNWLNPY